MNSICVVALALLLNSASSGWAGLQQDSNSPSAAQAPAATAPESSPPAPASQSQSAPQKETPTSHPAKQGCRVNAKTGKCIPGAHRHVRPTHNGKPHKVVVREGGITEPKVQLVPGLTQEQARRQRQNAEQLLTSAENNLYLLAGRTLSQNQQDTAVQVRNYMAGARSALKQGDPQRARNLAFKANLLSDDLAKH